MRSLLLWWMPNAVHGVPGNIERIEVDFPLFSSMEIRGQCVMREGWDTKKLSRFVTQDWIKCCLKLWRTDWALARSLQAGCRHSNSAHQPLHSLGQLGDCLCCTRMCGDVHMYICTRMCLIRQRMQATYPKIARRVSCENFLASLPNVIVPLSDGERKMIGAVLSSSQFTYVWAWFSLRGSADRWGSG